jgi:hypothetical protein
MSTIGHNLNPYPNRNSQDNSGIKARETNQTQELASTTQPLNTRPRSQNPRPGVSPASETVTALPDSITLSQDIQAIDSQFINPTNAAAATPLLQLLTDNVIGMPSGSASGPVYLRPDRVPEGELPAEIGSVPHTDKDPLLEMIAAMKASLRQVGT